MKRAPFLVLTLALVPACHTYLPGTAKSVPSFDQDARVLRVGVGRADITPPPGVSTFGHGPDARVTNGLWTRLYCRAFVFVQPDARAPSDPKSDHAALAIVPCDLPAMSAILQRSVAAEVAARVPIPAPRLMLTATHTHAGPAHYFDGNGYSGLGSTQLPGYDPEMVRFLSTRIAEAIEQAYQSAVPAKLRWSDGQVLTLTRNRNIQAFVRNSNPPWAPGCNERSELCAIDPNLSVLEVETVGSGGGPGCPLGSLTFFAMHPTVLPNTTQLLGADAFGVASRSLELAMRQGAASTCEKKDPLAGIVNTNEGDVVPRWVNGSVEEAISVGVALASEVKRLETKSGTKFRDASSLAMRYAEVDMRNNGFGMPPGRHTCSDPDLGVYGSMGATDHRTFLFPVLGDDDTRDTTRTDCQAPKTSFPWYVRGESSGPKAFPTVLPFAVARIDDHAITFVPAELTVAAGQGVNRAVRNALGNTVKAAVIAGLANSYIQYVTTRAEYDVQGYEGASTLFGPASAELIANIAGALAERLDSDTPLPFDIDQAHGHEYFASPVRARLPQGAGDPSLQELAGERNPVSLCAIRESHPPAVCFFWTDGAPGVVPIGKPSWISMARSDGTVVLDDRGVEFLTRIHRPYGDAWLWSTLVRPATLDPERPVDWATLGAGQTLTVRVGSPGDTKQIQSEGFTASSLNQLRACSSGVQRLCGL